MYDLPSLENVSKVVVDESVIEHKTEPYLIYQTPAGRSPRSPRPSERAAVADRAARHEPPSRRVSVSAIPIAAHGAS